MGKMDLILEKFADADNKELLEKFLENSTLEDMYNFCLSIDKDLTKEEFDKFALDAIESFGSEVEQTINEEELEKISGGIGLSESDKKVIEKHILNKYSK